jgi:hypothetical protein
MTDYKEGSSSSRRSGQRSRYSDSIRVGRSGDRIPVKARFSVPVLPLLVAHSAFCTTVTGSFSGVNMPERAANHALPGPRLPMGCSYTSASLLYLHRRAWGDFYRLCHVVRAGLGVGRVGPLPRALTLRGRQKGGHGPATR